MNPLALPELRTHVGLYLATRDILVCILVCQAWCQDFRPLLYRSLRLDDATLKILPKETIRKHAHLFRHLVIMEPMQLSLSSLESWENTSWLGNESYNSISLETWSKMTLASSPPNSPNSPKPPSIVPSPTLSQPPTTYNLISLDIHPSIMFRKRVHDTIPKHKTLLVGTDQYDIDKDDFWCLKSTDACIRLMQLNPNLKSLTESWDDMSSFHRTRFMNQLINQKNRLVKLHLSKWELTHNMLNQLIENSPMLEYLRFSKLNITNETGKAVKLRDERPLQTDCHLSLPKSTLNLRQLKVFAMAHATAQASNFHIDAPNLIGLCVSFSQVYFGRPSGFCSAPSFISNSADLPNMDLPKVIWNAPKLERLICNRTETKVSATTMFETARSLKTISMADYEIDSTLVAQFVALQGPYLESIRLACFSGITAKDIRLILTKCPNLVSLYAPEIMMFAGDLVASRNDSHQNKDDDSEKEWVCSKIERLSVYICLDQSAFDFGHGTQFYPFQQYQFLQKPSTDINSDVQQRHSLTPLQSWSHSVLEAQHWGNNADESRVQSHKEALLDQISLLTRLKHLDLSGEHVENVDHVQIGIPFTLRGGLEKLGSLKCLEHVAVTGWINEMGIEEIKWMKRSWPNLKNMSLLKTHIDSMNKSLIAEAWPELKVQDKDRNNSYCPPLYLYS
ncbi:hypothetical protein BGZ76_002806 [Entomortierella beljakovae]|nr:hypothetical protein BGZ76_002806 [Entomortierella beljakovae]